MDYDFSVDSDTLEKKFTGLSGGMNVFVAARGKIWQISFKTSPNQPLNTEASQTAAGSG